MLSIVEKRNTFGFTFIDATTNRFFIGEFEDDENKRMLRTLISRFKPVEIIFSNFISSETLNLLKHSSNKPTFSRIKSDLLKLEEIFKHMDFYFTEEKDIEKMGEIDYNDLIKSPGVFLDIKKAVAQFIEENPNNTNEENFPFYLTLQALNHSLVYLKQIILDQTVFLMGNFELYDINSEKSFSLFLDSQALLNLELLECGYQSKVFKKFTLFEYMDKTKTPFGKRMLEKWMISPLKNVEEINERLDAVEDLMKTPEVADYCQLELAKLPDIERKLYRVCNFANEKRLTAAYFENDYVNNRLKEFVGLLNDLKKTEGIVTIFAEYIKKFKSKRLRQLVSFKTIKNESLKKSTKKFEGLMPKMSEIIDEIEKMVRYVEGVPCPAPGIDQEYDALLIQVIYRII